MKNPQTTAAELYERFPCDNLKTIKDNACCAFVLLWCLGLEPDDAGAIIMVDRMLKAGTIGKDCLVKWSDATEYLTGRKCKVEFKDIKTLQGIKNRTPVMYEYKGMRHWVGVEKGMLCFDPLKISPIVMRGSPVSARILMLEGVDR